MANSMRNHRALHDKPLADYGQISYRYRALFGWVMIGATDIAGALSEAGRSISTTPQIENLQVWNGQEYVPVAD